MGTGVSSALEPPPRGGEEQEAGVDLRSRTAWRGLQPLVTRSEDRPKEPACLAGPRAPIPEALEHLWLLTLGWIRGVGSPAVSFPSSPATWSWEQVEGGGGSLALP